MATPAPYVHPHAATAAADQRRAELDAIFSRQIMEACQ